MKLSSSSIFLATLALSSSTSALAAPAPIEPGLSVSSSSQDIFNSSVHPAGHCSHKAPPQPTPVEDKSQALAARSNRKSHTFTRYQPIKRPLVPLADILGQVATHLMSSQTMVTPELASLLSTLFTILSTSLLSAEGNTAEAMTALQSVAQKVIEALNSKAPSPVQSVVNGLSVPVTQNDFDPAGGLAAAAPPLSGASSMSSAQPSAPPAPAALDAPSPSFPSPSPSPPLSPAIPIPIPVNHNSTSLPVHPPVQN